jgi:single-stranded DNA-binding protein
MNHINSILIEGNLVRNPILLATSDGTVCTFSIATNNCKDSGSDYRPGRNWRNTVMNWATRDEKSG